MKAEECLARLSAQLARLPGVGRRTAERMAIRLAREPDGLLRDLCRALEETAEHVRMCSLCGGLTSRDRDPCALCTDPRRDAGLLGVVEEAGDIALIEKTGVFRGRYHALGGKLSPAGNTGPSDLRLDRLLQRIREEPIKEVLLALNTDVESEATCAYLREQLRPSGVRVTRLAMGLPAGSGLQYADPITLARALQGRQEI